MITDRIHGRRLENQQYKGGIPRLPPQKLTPLFLRLPPILYQFNLAAAFGESGRQGDDNRRHENFHQEKQSV